MNRSKVSVPYNQWSDAQRVDRDDMNTEQDRNVQIDGAIINNHFGSGVLPDSIEQKILLLAAAEFAAEAAEFLLFLRRKAVHFGRDGADVERENFFEFLTAVFGQVDKNIAAIFLAALPAHKAARFQFVDNGHDIALTDQQFLADLFLGQGTQVVEQFQRAELGVA